MSTESFNSIELNHRGLYQQQQYQHFHGYNHCIQSIFLRCRCHCDLFAVTSTHTCRGIRNDCCRVFHSFTFVWFARIIIRYSRYVYINLYRYFSRWYIFAIFIQSSFVFFFQFECFISVNNVMATFSYTQSKTTNEIEEKTFSQTTIAHIRNSKMLYVYTCVVTKIVRATYCIISTKRYNSNSVICLK